MRRRFSVPIRWRLGLTSAALTFVILLAFALVTSAFTASRLKSDFDTNLVADAADLATRIPTDEFRGVYSPAPDDTVGVAIDYAASGDGVVRILNNEGEAEVSSAGSRTLGLPDRVGGLDGLVREGRLTDAGDFRLITRPIFDDGRPDRPAGFLQVGASRESLTDTLTRVNVFLALGVLLGTGLALVAGLAVARRAMTPIADLTYAAKHVARTRDPAVRVPRSRAKDEVADLSRTLDDMLAQLDAARTEIEQALRREREFVADASHELRTPLTSVLANLELLEERLEGEDAEIASSALRSTQRMRRLVADLLFLARADTGHVTPPGALDLGRVVSDAVAETAPLTGAHEVRVEAPSGIWVVGIADDLHRLVVNLIQNSLSHTPPETIVRVRLRRKAATMRPTANGSGEAESDLAILEVSDNGPGIPAEARARIFERFVRAPGGGSGSGASGSGLGLAIVGAVAASHGGSVKLTESPDGGARFVVHLPSVEAPARQGVGASDEEATVAAAQTSTTTGRTSGRRFRRS